MRELLVLMKSYAKRNARQNYELATNIATLVGVSIGGKKGQKPPSLYRMYPELFKEEKELEDYNRFRAAMYAKSKLHTED